MVSGLTFKSLIYFVYGVKIVVHVDIQFFQHHLLKGLSFLHCVLLVPLSNSC